MNAPSSIPVFPVANPYVDTNRSGGGMTKNKIENLIKTTMASSQLQQNTDLQAIAKSFQETMFRATKTLVNKGEVTPPPSDDYNYDPVDDITDKPDSDSDSSSNDTSSSDSSDSDTSSFDSSDSDDDLNVHIANASGQNDVSSSTKDSDEFNLEEESLDDPIEIYFVQKKEPEMSVATVKCKIKHLKIPAMILDSGAEPPIITENIVERIGAKINKSEIHDLEGISTVLVESIGVVRNLPITLAFGLTIIEDFIIMRYRKPTLIFSNKLLKKYGCAVD
ncbi:hypothetical protein GLOIN_2v1886689 [Rhizophagus clarus]|uniref:Uncharacterized protein n=1 Tax=Rhizophagus clarus TaxID=94130 RepID=A0A8H3LN21_9GLOM|nr:hypothetical protein GLOIN_2v1886689 [Rhizophagus clarus]